jgi:HlyD family secretion protein
MNIETEILSAEKRPVYLDDDMPVAPSRKRRWWIIALILLALLASGAAAYYFLGKKDAGAGEAAKAASEKAAKEEQQQSVTVISPGQQTLVRSINATGTLAARYDVPIGVVGEGGLVSRVFVNAGDWVREGQVLVSIDRAVQNQQAVASAAQIEVARTDLQLAQNELDRAMQLVDRGFISKADVDRKVAARNNARARVGVAQAQLGELKERNSRLDIRAPNAGYILARTVEPGQTVGPGGALFRMARGGEMELQAQLGEADLASVSVGVSAAITPVGADRVFNGRIWQISPLIDPQSRQGIARIALPFDRSLRPGGFAKVAIQAGAFTAPILPESAVQNDKEGSYVYIVDAVNKVERRAVKTGEVTPNGLPIIEGLTGTEKVVLFAGGFLNPGETIKPKLQAPIEAPSPAAK